MDKQKNPVGQARFENQRDSKAESKVWLVGLEVHTSLPNLATMTGNREQNLMPTVLQFQIG